MANTITNILPTILAMGMKALREQPALARLVNRDPYTGLAAQPGNVINVPIPSAIAARSVTPSVVMNSNVAFSPTTVAVTLDRWMEAPFELTDNDTVSIANGYVPMQVSEAVKSLINDIDVYILSKHVRFFSQTGNAGTTPNAATLTEARAARVLLNKTLAPFSPRYGVLDADAEGSLLGVPNVIQSEMANSGEAITNGLILRKLGIDWYLDQNLTANTFTPGTAWITGWTFDGSNQAGVSTAQVVFTNSGTVKIGDIFSLTAGGLGYVVTAATTAVTATTMALSFYPALRSTVATAAVLVIGQSGTTAYVPNLVFQRDAYAFASRPLASLQGYGNDMLTQTDPETGIALRLEVSRQYKLTTFSFDVLYGCNVVRPELGAKIRG